MGYYDELGECDISFYRQQCVYLRDGIDDRSCVRPNCSRCTYAAGRKPYCKFAYNESCTYYNCYSCPEAEDDNEICKLHARVNETGVV